jgi:hypothetical protein
MTYENMPSPIFDADVPRVRGPRHLADAQLNTLATLTRAADERINERAQAALSDLAYAADTESAGTRAHVLAREMQAHVETLGMLARTADPYRTPDRAYSRLGDLVAVLMRDEPDARDRLERGNAARACERALQRVLANQTTTDNPGLVPTLFPEQTGYGKLGMPTSPLLATIATPLAKFSATIDVPMWDAVPTAGIVTGQKVATPSNAANLDPVSLSAATAAISYNVSQQLLDSTTFADELDVAMRLAVDAALEGYVCTTLLGVATNHAATQSTLLDTLGTVWAAIGAAWHTSEPDVIVSNVGGAFSVRRALGTANMGTIMPTVIGTPAMPANEVLVFPRGAVACYVGDPVSDAKTEPNILGQEVAAYRYGAVGARVAAAVHSLTLS